MNSQFDENDEFYIVRDMDGDLSTESTRGNQEDDDFNDVSQVYSDYGGRVANLDDAEEDEHDRDGEKEQGECK